MDAERYIKLNKLTRHELLFELLRAQDRATNAEARLEATHKALDAYLNKGMTAQDAMVLVRRAHYPTWGPTA